MGGGIQGYPYVGPSREEKPPDYARVARALSDAELEEEIRLGLGGPEYQLTLVRELERRAQAGPPEED